MSKPTGSNYSAELMRVPPQSVTYSPLKPSEEHGRVRMAYFTRAVAAEAQNTLIGLCKIPKNARVLKGKFSKSATTGATVNYDIGLCGKDNSGYIDDTVGATVADAPAHFGNIANTTAAQVADFADTAAQNMGYTLVKDCYLTLTVKDAAVSAAATISGYVLYVVD